MSAFLLRSPCGGGEQKIAVKWLLPRAWQLERHLAVPSEVNSRRGADRAASLWRAGRRVPECYTQLLQLAPASERYTVGGRASDGGVYRDYTRRQYLDPTLAVQAPRSFLLLPIGGRQLLLRVTGGVRSCSRSCW